MSDTPRTDAMEIELRQTYDDVGFVNFARQLERENVALRSLAQSMADEMEQHGGEMAFDTLARYRAEMGRDKP